MLEPLAPEVERRFNLWLGREKNAGRDYSEEQASWLRLLRDAVAANTEVLPADLREQPQFQSRGGMARARRLFGADRMEGLLEELSSAGAMGLMQVMPQTYATLRARLGLGANAYDPHDNIMAGAAFLRDMHDRYGDAGFLAAYNAGTARYEEFRTGGRALPSETILYMARLGPMLGLDGGVALAVNVTSVAATPEAAPIFVSLRGNVAVVGPQQNSTANVQLAAADVQVGDRAAGLFTSRVQIPDRTPANAERAPATPLSTPSPSGPTANPVQFEGQRDTIFVQRGTVWTSP